MAAEVFPRMTSQIKNSRWRPDLLKACIIAIPDRGLLQQLHAKDVLHVEHSIVLTLKITSGGSRPSDKGRRGGGGGHPNPEIRVGGRSQKNFFLSLSLIILFTNVQNKNIYTYIKVQ